MSFKSKATFPIATVMLTAPASLKMTTIRRAFVAATAAALLAAAAPSPVSAKVYKNCTALNKAYPHGVGRKGAKDKTSGTPVTTFTVSNSVYNENKKSDRDKDGIACEKA